MMTTETVLLQRLQTSFGNYISSPEDIANIRHRIASHLQDFLHQEAGPFPTYIHGLRKKFLQAALANRDAERKLSKLQKNNTITSSGDAQHQPLTAHLEVLRLRKQHQNYEAVSYYASALEDISKQERALEIRPTNGTKVSDASTIETGPSGSRVNELILALETALLKTNHQLRREKHLLSRIETHPETSSSSNLSKLYALEATRAELTSWIEESLAKCDHSEPSDGTLLARNRDQQPEIDVFEEYNRYCESRSRLLSSLTALFQPLPAIEPLEHAQPEAVPRPPESILSAVESHFLPPWKENNIVRQQLGFLTESIDDNAQQLTEHLRRLHDESHLLPAYPILSKTHRRLRSASDNNDNKNNGKPEHGRMLEAWGFANEAAQITTGAAISKYSSEGHEATEHAMSTLESIKTRSGMWQQV